MLVLEPPGATERREGEQGGWIWRRIWWRLATGTTAAVAATAMAATVACAATAAGDGGRSNCHTSPSGRRAVATAAARERGAVGAVDEK